MMKKIVISGGTGFLGSALTGHFLENQYEVVVLTRSASRELGNLTKVQWDAQNLGAWTRYLEDAEVLINLCGKSVDCRYNAKNGQEILESRTESTTVLGKAIQELENPPKLWINSSSATIYPHAEFKEMTEKDNLGSGFSVEVCKAWEKAFFDSEVENTRKIAIRSSMVFGNEGSVYKTLKSLALKGLGGTQGNGKQFISWIHIEDFIRAIDFIIQHKELDGAINICSPDPRPNKEFNRLLRKSLGVKIHFPVKEWMVYLGAIFMRTEAELVLKSRRVVPDRLLNTGFQFKYNKLENAFEELTESLCNN